MRAPRVIVCAGGGGVGKTTTSAALALALAARGHRTLIVTIDPARRLAGAMGVPITDELTLVPLAADRTSNGPGREEAPPVAAQPDVVAVPSTVRSAGPRITTTRNNHSVNSRT